MFELKNIPMIKDPNDQYKKVPDFTSACRKNVMVNSGKLLGIMKSYGE